MPQSLRLWALPLPKNLLTSLFLPLVSFLGGCRGQPPEGEGPLAARVDELISQSGEEIAVYYRDLETGDSLLIHPDLPMHAASTMKIPVMIQLYLDRDAGRISLDDSLEVTTTFSSIVDGSPYSLAVESDSESDLYNLVGKKVTYSDLIERMITLSSNLATNILIQEAGAERVTTTMRSLGADSIQVLRGVEDGPAFRAGLSNTTTARDLGVIMEALALGTIGASGASEEMLEILSRQHWNTKIPALLPPGTLVAHKTGRITGISHDAGVVAPQGSPPYVLVLLTRGFEDGEEADAVAAQISRVVFDHHTALHRE